MAGSSSSPSPEQPKGVFVWGDKNRKFACGIKVGPRKVYIGRRDTREEAEQLALLAASLRETRRAAGQPLTKSELQGGPATGPDLFTQAVDAKLAASRRARMQERRFRAWAEKNLDLAREIVASLTRRRRSRSADTSSAQAPPQATEGEKGANPSSLAA